MCCKKRHFGGAAADPSYLKEMQYASTLGGQFAQLEPENQMKFGPIHPRPGSDSSAYDFSPADQNSSRLRNNITWWFEDIALFGISKSPGG